MKKWQRILLAVVLIFLTLVLVIFPAAITWMNYDEAFGERVETEDYIAFDISDYPDLTEETGSFQVDNKTELTSFYYQTKQDPKALLVLSHALGGDHRVYYPVIKFFIDNGYDVFAYDGTGVGQSAGNAIGAMPQAVKDLDAALNYVEGDDRFGDLPIVLLGHSRGAYASGAVVELHPEVKAAVLLSGQDRSIDFMTFVGEQMVGAQGMSLLTPYFALYEQLRYGKFAKTSLTNSIENTGTRFLLVHSLDDDVASYETGFKKFQEQYADDHRFEFVSYGNAGHDRIYNSQAVQDYANNFREELKAKAEAEGWDSTQRKQYYIDNFNRDETEELNKELFDKILKFYDEALQ